MATTVPYTPRGISALNAGSSFAGGVAQGMQTGRQLDQRQQQLDDNALKIQTDQLTKKKEKEKEFLDSLRYMSREEREWAIAQHGWLNGPMAAHVRQSAMTGPRFRKPNVALGM